MTGQWRANTTNDSVAYWAAVLRREIAVAGRRKRKRIVRRMAILGIPVFLFFLTKGHHLHFPWFWWVAFSAGGALADRAATREQAANALARTDDPRAISALAIACRVDPKTAPTATAGLIRLLPRLKATDAGVITKEGMAALIALLQRPDPELVLVLLKALEQIGDSRAIPAVQALLVDQRATVRCRWLHTYDSSDWGRVRAAAAECLPALEDRAEHDRQRSLLLRAAGSDPQSLLRPASVTDTPPEQLLRVAAE